MLVVLPAVLGGGDDDAGGSAEDPLSNGVVFSVRGVGLTSVEGVAVLSATEQVSALILRWRKMAPDEYHAGPSLEPVAVGGAGCAFGRSHDVSRVCVFQ